MQKMDAKSKSSFPTAGILPKGEIQAAEFIAKNPKWDGRGTTVAVFDTGVDPGAPGLSTTSDGKPKIIDIIDCSGSGDVDTSTVIKSSSLTLTGLSGRTLTLSKEWKNPTGTWMLGLKRAYELFPKELISRMKTLRKEKFLAENRSIEAELHRQLTNKSLEKKDKSDLEARLAELASMEKSFEDPGPVYDCVVFHDGSNWQAVVDTREDGNLAAGKPLMDYAVARQFATFSGDDMLNYSVKIYDEGRCLCIVANAGAHGTHVAGIIGAYFPGQEELNGIAPGSQIISVKIGDSRLGSMETGAALERALIAVAQSKADLINMSYGEAVSRADVGRFCDLAKELINKHGVIFVSSAGNEGPRLSTVGAPGGTTSGIIGVGAYVSPSMMEASYSLLKTLPENHFTWSSRGPTYDGDPGVCISACGGAIAPVPNWCLAKNQLMNGTSMSSPAACGGIALLVSALKAQGKDVSPHAVRRAIENTARPIKNVDRLAQGCGLLQVVAAHEYLTKYGNTSDQGIVYQVTLPARNQARGIYLREPSEVAVATQWSVTVNPVFPDLAEEEEEEKSPEVKDAPQPQPPASTGAAGNAPAPATPTANPMSVSPAPSKMRARINKEKVDFQMRVSLVSTAKDWLQCPSAVVLYHGGRAFNVGVNPAKLEPGVHFGEVLGLDSACPERGPIFRVPVTVCINDPVPGAPLIAHMEAKAVSGPTHAPAEAAGCQYTYSGLNFQPGQVFRRFVTVPTEATWADVSVTGRNLEGKRTWMLHCGYLLSETPHRDVHLKDFFTIAGCEERAQSMAVVGGTTLEVCLAQFWSSLGDSCVDLEVNFHALPTDLGEVAFTAARGVQRIDVHAPLRTENLSPSATLTHLQQPVRPSSAEIKPPKDRKRDTLPNGSQVYDLVLTYQWEAKERTSMVLRAPMLQGVLYESVFSAQFWMVFDANKFLMHSGDSWPDFVSVNKGKYTIRLQVRHDKPSQLEALKDMPALIESKLSKPVKIEVFQSFNDAVIGGSVSSALGLRFTVSRAQGARFAAKSLEQGGRKALYLGAPDVSSAKAVPGDILTGVLTLSSGNSRTPHSSDLDKRPAPIHVQYYVAPAPIPPPPPAPAAPVAKPAEAKAGEEGKDKTADFNLEEEMRDLQIEYITKQKDEKQLKAFNELFPPLLNKFPKHLPLLSLRLTVQASRKDSKKHLPEIIDAASAVIAEVDQDKLAAHFGVILAADDEKAQAQRKDFDKIKSQLVEAMFKRAEAIMFQLKEADAKENKVALTDEERKTKTEQFKQAYAELFKFTEKKDAKFQTLHTHYDVANGHIGLALKTANAGVSSVIESGALPSKDLLSARIDVLERLGWKQWAAYERVWMAVRFPKDFTPF